MNPNDPLAVDTLQGHADETIVLSIYELDAATVAALAVSRMDTRHAALDELLD